MASAGLQASVKLRDYREIGAESFDKIVHVGMFEHVGENHLPEYFAHVYRLLKPGGLFLNHAISRRAPVQYAITRSQKLCCPPSSLAIKSSSWQKFIERYLIGSDTFAQRNLFSGEALILISEVNTLAEAVGFEVRNVENLREHYALTLRHWANRLEAHHVDAIKAADEITYRTWRLYMVASAYGFESGNINANQTLFAKMDKGRSSVPLTRADLYTA
jgi:cyclopropane-fatty-acyl-phospholipid synthase